MRQRILLLVQASLAIAAWLAAAPGRGATELTHSRGLRDVFPESTRLADPEGTLTVEAALELERRGRFEPTGLARGRSAPNGRVWYALRLRGGDASGAAS